MIGSEGRTSLTLLRNPRHEKFAQLVATGQSPAQAYVAAGYEERTSYTCGPRLLKRIEVLARVNELRKSVAQSAVNHAGLNREFVLTELMDNAIKAKENQEWSASNRALELLGKELGLFVDRSDHSFHWDGRLDSLTDIQLGNVQAHFLELAKAERRRMLEAGAVVDLEPVPNRDL
jgi:hypothetical protein